MANIFVNREEGRLRALWRLILQVLLFIVPSGLISILIGIAVGLVAVSQGINVQDPMVIQQLSNSPLVRGINSVGTLLIMLFSAWAAARWLDHRPFRAFGFHFNRGWWLDFAFGLALGAVLMVFIFGVELAAGWVTITGTMQSFRTGSSFWAGILTYVVVFFCVGIYEELLSRGYQLRNLAEGLNLRWLNPRVALLLAYLISSSVFGALHAANPGASLVSTLNLIVAGLFLGLGYILTGELAISIGLHMTWNFFQGNVFGFPVSGGQTSASFIGIQQGGPDLWTGGVFGPEAGLMGIAAILLGCLFILLWVRFTRGEVQIKEALAVYPKKSQPVAENLPEAAQTELMQSASSLLETVPQPENSLDGKDHSTTSEPLDR